MRAQAARAIETGDVAALRTLAASSPERAAEAVVRVLACDAPDPAAVVIAEDVAGSLRKRGSIALARKLALAGQGASAILRLELGLLAFSSGDDVEAARVAAADVAAGRLLEPLLVAARRAARGPRARPKEGTAASASLHAIARTVFMARTGRITEARRAISRAGGPHAGLVRDAVGLASRGDPLKARAAHERIQQAALDPALEGVGTAALIELAEIDPDLALKEATRLSAPAEAIARIQARRGASDPGAYAGPSAAAAWIHRGFELLRTNRAEASRAFDRAIELDGDLVEALRGKLLVAGHDGAACRDCGHHHDDRDPRSVAVAAERLAKVLRRETMGAVLAGEASLIAADAWSQIDPAATVRAIDAARADLGQGASRRLDVVEAEARLGDDPARTLVLADGLLARDPEDVDAIKLRLGALKRMDRQVEWEASLAAVGATTTDPSLRKLARGLSRAPPFEGLSPGKVTPGELAAELDRATRLLAPGSKDDPMTPLAWTCRDALPPEGRLAFDAAALGISEGRGVGPSPGERLQQLLRRSAPQADRVRWLSTLAGFFAAGSADRLPAAAALASLPSAGPLLVALAEGAAIVEDDDSARAILVRFSSVLSRSEIKAIERAIGDDDPDLVDRKLDAIAEALRPDFDLFDLPDRPQDLAFDQVLPGLDLPPGLPEELLSLMPPELLARIERMIKRGGNTSAEDRKLTEDLARFIEHGLGAASKSKGRSPWA